jgi:hypothetical protein
MEHVNNDNQQIAYDVLNTYYFLSSRKKLSEEIVSNNRFKYIYLYDWEEGEFVLHRLTIGHLDGEFSAELYDNVIYINNKGVISFNIKSMITNLRYVVSFLVQLFEDRPFLKTLLINGLPHFTLTRDIPILKAVLKTFNSLFIIQWLPGTFSNKRTIMRYWRLAFYKKLKNEEKRSWYRKSRKNNRRLRYVPQLLVALSVIGKASIPIREYAKIRIPILALVDSNGNRRGGQISYPIYGSDDSILGSMFYLSILRRAIVNGKLIGHIKIKRLIGSESSLSQKKIRRGKKKKLKKGRPYSYSIVRKELEVEFPSKTHRFLKLFSRLKFKKIKFQMNRRRPRFYKSRLPLSKFMVRRFMLRRNYKALLGPKGKKKQSFVRFLLLKHFFKSEMQRYSRFFYNKSHKVKRSVYSFNMSRDWFNYRSVLIIGE